MPRTTSPSLDWAVAQNRTPFYSVAPGECVRPEPQRCSQGAVRAPPPTNVGSKAQFVDLGCRRSRCRPPVVQVPLGGLGDVLVAEPFAHDLDGHALLDKEADKEAPVGVPQVVEPDGRYACPGDDPPERFVDRVGMDDIAVASGEDPLLGTVDGDRGELGGLERLPRGEHGEGGVIERDRSVGVAGHEPAP